MKLCLIFFNFFVVSFCCAQSLRPKELACAMREGADTKIIFRVVDDQSNVVTGATVNAHFVLNDNKGKDIIGQTDENGLIVLQRKSVGEVIYCVKKEGCYDAEGWIWLAGTRGKLGEVKDGKWQPYGREEEVVLKRKLNPVCMTSYMFEDKLPITTGLGFDLLVGDYIRPYGTGECADFYLDFQFEQGDAFYREHKIMTFVFTNALDGAYVLEKNLCKREMKSQFQTIYHANTNSIYKKEIVFDVNTLNPKGVRKATFTEDSYLVVRTRTKVNEKGEVVEAYYSKILGPWAFSKEGVRFSVRANPTVNDTNLEDDLEVRGSMKPSRKWKK